MFLSRLQEAQRGTGSAGDAACLPPQRCPGHVHVFVHGPVCRGLQSGEGTQEPQDKQECKMLLSPDPTDSSSLLLHTLLLLYLLSCIPLFLRAPWSPLSLLGLCAVT